MGWLYYYTLDLVPILGPVHTETFSCVFVLFQAFPCMATTFYFGIRNSGVGAREEAGYPCRGKIDNIRRGNSSTKLVFLTIKKCKKSLRSYFLTFLAPPPRKLQFLDFSSFESERKGYFHLIRSYHLPPPPPPPPPPQPSSPCAFDG